MNLFNKQEPADKVEELQGILATTIREGETFEQEIEVLGEEMRPLALESDRGKNGAAKRYTELEHQAEELERKRKKNGLKRAEVERRLAEAKEDAARAEREAKAVQIREGVAVVMETSKRADAAMKELSAALGERQQALNALRDTIGGKQSAWLTHENGPRLSAEHHGLRGPLPIPMWPGKREHLKELHVLDGDLLRRFEDVAEWPPEGGGA